MGKYGFVLALSALLLPGCSWIYGEDGLFPDNTDRYQDAPELAVITVPPTASKEALDPTYPIPDVKQSFLLESEFEVPRPTPLTGSNQYETVRIQRLADESWARIWTHRYTICHPARQGVTHAISFQSRHRGTAKYVRATRAATKPVGHRYLLASGI
jgi:uncharacterized lipoprotein